MVTRAPAWASTSLAIRPAGPPPTIATSGSLALGMPALSERSRSRASLLAANLNREGRDLRTRSQSFRPRDADRHDCESDEDRKRERKRRNQLDRLGRGVVRGAREHDKSPRIRGRHLSRSSIQIPARVRPDLGEAVDEWGRFREFGY